MTAILILRNGKRVTINQIPAEYLDTLLSFGIFAGYILKHNQTKKEKS